MKVNELIDKSKVSELILELGERRKPRVAGTTAVQDVMARDETGTCKLSLWGEDIVKFKDAKKVKLTNGWATCYQSVFNVSAGKFGKIEVIDETKPIPVLQGLKIPSVPKTNQFEILERDDVKAHVESCVAFGEQFITTFGVDNRNKPQAYVDWAKTEDGGSMTLDDGQLIVVYNEILSRIKEEQ